MIAKLIKPYTDIQRNDFIVEYNHKARKQIVETDIALYALEPWESVENDQIIEDREGYARRKAEEEKEAKKQKILQELDALDLKSIRAIRANDEEYIAQYEAQAQKLREELKELQ